MDWTVPIAALAAAGGLSLLLWLVLAGSPRSKTALANLTRGLSATGATPQARGGRRIGRVVARPSTVGRLNGLLGGAGRPAAWPLDRVLDAKLFGLLVGMGLGAFLALRSPGPLTIMFALALAAFGFFLPELLLYNAALKRREAVALELPDTLDQMSIAVDAGLGFDSAMLRVARAGKGVLAQELIRTLQDIQVGQSRREAYESLAERCGVPTLSRFIRSVIQAEEYGIALADVLRTQADEMRIERRQRAEHKAMQIPVKVVFPLVLMLLPALMIVIMGPAAIGIMEAFNR